MQKTFFIAKNFAFLAFFCKVQKSKFGQNFKNFCAFFCYFLPFFLAKIARFLPNFERFFAFFERFFSFFWGFFTHFFARCRKIFAPKFGEAEKIFQKNEKNF